MNRLQRRRAEQKQKRPRYSLIDVQKAMNIALEMRKHSKGHLFSKTLKDTCVFCGATMKTRTMCKFWFLTFLDRMQVTLINPTFFMDDNVEALWMQSSSEYQDVQIPLNISSQLKKDKK